MQNLLIFHTIGQKIISILLQHLISKLSNISDLICEVSNFQHHKNLCSKLRSNLINQFENASLFFGKPIILSFFR
jgi:hypothetical protein